MRIISNSRLWITVLLGGLVGSPAVFAEQYVAKNCEWAKRLEELTQARIKRIKGMGFEIVLRNEKILRRGEGGNQEIEIEKTRGLVSEDQKDCILRELKELENFLKESKYQTYLKSRKTSTIWLSVLDNTEGKLPDTQLKYGPELRNDDSDTESKDKKPNPTLVVRPAITSKRSCVTVTYENLAFSFDWWDQSENGL